MSVKKDPYHVTVRRSSDGTHGSTARTAISPVLAPAALDGTTMHHLPLQLDDSHSGVLVCVELDEGEPAISLHADFREIPDGLEEGDKVRLGAVGHKVASTLR